MVLIDHHSIEDIQTKVIHEFSKTLNIFGLSTADSHLFVTLYLHKSPMTLDEMSNALGKSKTSMSTGIRSLLEQGLVERVWKKGVRKDLYQANENLYKNLMSSYIHKCRLAAGEQKSSLMKMENELSSSSKDGLNEEYLNRVDDLYGRMQDMIKFHEWIEETFHTLKTNRSFSDE
ncbi:GbsR/MarR family transcriptional regulator [Halobacillus litoralis]|uniref:GbsR/MarR family transcriptional regulator n=1 Tax=Halobacillus litoralis TaxID=45668 RepID=UPI001CFF02AE|nr:helix-turn-helix domain-containing protein [Halobacillus litoralis]